MTYPPLTPVADYPLHGWDYGHSYACFGSGIQQYDWRCPFCVALAEREVVLGRDAEVAWKQDAASPEQTVTLSWLVARSRFHGIRQVVG